MILLRGSGSDLLNCRFAVSPLWETMATVRSVLHQRSTTRVDATRAGSLSGPASIGLKVLAPFLPQHGYAPDFLTPPPEASNPTIEDELRRVADVPLDQVAAELDRTLRGQFASHDRLRREIEVNPGGVRDRLLTAVHIAWRQWAEPGWAQHHQILLADVRHRGQRLAEHGLTSALNELHSAIRVRGNVIAVQGRISADRDLDRQGLLLVPALSGLSSITVVTDPPWRPMLVYRARGAGAMRPASATSSALSDLIGTGRAAVLASLDRPQSTTRLSRNLGRSASTVSRHLSILQSAGLADSYRNGHDVVYYRTNLGNRLLRR